VHEARKHHPVQLVIFDCDGTLVDSERIAARIDSEVVTELGWALTADEIIDRFVGRDHAHFVAEVSRQLGKQLERGWDAPYASRYHEAFEQELTLVEGVSDTLERLEVPMCVASNSQRAHIERVLRITGLLERFEGSIYCAEDVAGPKPAPDLFLHAAKQMGTDPSACLVVEDTPVGVEAARAAGMRVVVHEGTVVPRRLFPPDTTWCEHMGCIPELVLAG
jgi:HAD superfamily hydrolase (TIGR01509 family)